MRRLQTQVHVSRRRPAAALAVAFAIGVVALEPSGAGATAVQPAEFGVYPLPANFSMYEPEGLRQSCLFHGLPEHCGGEPSIGVDVSTNTAMVQMMLTTARIRWDDSQQPPAATWTNVSYTGFDWTGDPDGSTDRATGRTFNVQLCPSVACNPTPGTRRVGIASTDDDGASWNQPSEVVSPYADKPVIGSGPYHSPAPAAASYPSAVYLCAGDDFHWPSGNAYCYRSDDGGHTWGQAKVASPGTGPCLPFAGEVAVDGDGIVYLPLEHCGSRQGLASSSDNGETWRVTTVPGVRDAAQNFDEFPDVASDSDGRLYYAATGRGRPVVAVSDDQGRHWRPAVDVGAEAGIRYAQFPTLVAGDGGRAAFAFLGSTTPGYPENSNYTGAWHLYVAVTVDGGASWDASCRGQDTPALDDRQQRGVVARWLVLRLRLRACPRHRTRHRGDCAKDLRP